MHNSVARCSDSHIVPFAIERLRVGERVAIVSLVGREGTSQSITRQMAISGAGEYAGSILGGTHDGSIIDYAVSILKITANRNRRHPGIATLCVEGGDRVDIVVDERPSLQQLERINHLRENRLPASICVPIPAGYTTDNRYLVRHYQPPIRLVVVGEGPVVDDLCRFGRLASWEVHLYSADSSTISRALGMSGVEIIPLTKARRRVKLLADRYTAVVFGAVDLCRYKSVIEQAASSDAFYIGLTGRWWSSELIEKTDARGTPWGDLSRFHFICEHADGGYAASTSALLAVSEIRQAYCKLSVDKETPFSSIRPAL